MLRSAPAQDQPFFFSDLNDGISFQYHRQMPTNRRKLAKSKSGEGSVNITQFRMYSMYRNTVYDTYRQEPELAGDIKKRKPEYSIHGADEKDPHQKDPVYHYSVAACLGAMQEWADPKQKMQSFIARKKNPEGFNSEVGFVHFREDTVRGKPVVYIAQAGVQNTGNHLGRRLMECVFKHYPAGTEFYILTRVFNTKAKDLYGKRFKFTPIELDEIESLGYDNRYCGFKGKTTQPQLNDILGRVQPFITDEVVIEPENKVSLKK